MYLETFLQFSTQELLLLSVVTLICLFLFIVPISVMKRLETEQHELI